MAGIGNLAATPQPDPTQAQGAAAPTQGQDPSQDPTQGQDDTQSQSDGTEPNVTPEEQAQYNEFVGNGMKLIYRDDKNTVTVNPAVLDQLKGKWDQVKPSLGEMPKEDKPLDPTSPIDNLAVATVALILTLEASAASQSKQIDPGVLFHGGVELMEQLSEIAGAASIHDFTTDELTGAANRAAMVYGVSSKTVNKQQALAEFDNFLKTQGNNLGQSLSGIAQQGQQDADQQPQGGLQQGQQQPAQGA